MVRMLLSFPKYDTFGRSAVPNVDPVLRLRSKLVLWFVFMEKLYSVALVRWLRIRLCGSVFSIRETIFKLLTNSSFWAWVRCCGSVSISKNVANVKFYLKMLRLHFCGSASNVCY
jgi:hypothetical protein